MCRNCRRQTQVLRWRDRLFGSVVDELVRGSDDIDVYVLSGEEDTLRPPAKPVLERHSAWSADGWALAVVLLCTVLAWLVFPVFGESNLIMIYLLGIVAVARRSDVDPPSWPRS